MKKFRSSSRVEAAAERLEYTLKQQTKAIWAIGYTSDDDGYIILIYHGKLTKAVDKVSEAEGYRVQWVPSKKPRHA